MLVDKRPHRARQGGFEGPRDVLVAMADAVHLVGLLADDRGDRQLTTTAMSLTPPLPSSFQLASDEVHSWCASLDVPPETSRSLLCDPEP